VGGGGGNGSDFDDDIGDRCDKGDDCVGNDGTGEFGGDGKDDCEYSSNASITIDGGDSGTGDSEVGNSRTGDLGGELGNSKLSSLISRQSSD
jgi:hypothetical protein